MSNPWPMGNMSPRMAMNVAQHKIIKLLKTLRFFFVFISVCVFIVWPKTTLLPLWPPMTPKVWTPLTSRTGDAGALQGGSPCHTMSAWGHCWRGRGRGGGSYHGWKSSQTPCDIQRSTGLDFKSLENYCGFKA